ncbi:hypothetical protein D3C81_1441420 [compost metagenome]
MVGDAVVDHRDDAGVAQQHFVDAARGRVATEGGHHVVVEQTAQPRQGQGERLDDMPRLPLDLLARPRAGAGGMAQLQADLLQQGVERRVEGVADVEVFALQAQVGWPQEHGKQCSRQRLDHLAHDLARWQLALVWFAAAAMPGHPIAARGTQPVDNAF